MKTPSLKSATENTAMQRLFAFALIFGLVSVVLMWPMIRDNTGAAVAQVQDNNYQPFNCGAPATPNNQARRANLHLYNNAWNSYTNGKAYPCISGVKWKMEAGNTTWDLGASNCALATPQPHCGSNGVVALIAKIFPESDGTINFAGAGSASVTHMSLASLQFCSGTASEPSNFTNGYGCVRKVQGAKMYADSSTSPTVKPLIPYVLNTVPNGALTVGGSGVLTDLWADPASVMAVPFNSMPLGSTACGTLGVSGNSRGSGSTGTCEFTVSSLSGGLAQNLSSGGNFAVTGMNMTFYYLISHAQGSSNPYSSSELALNSIQLPNTRIKVGDGS